MVPGLPAARRNHGCPACAGGIPCAACCPPHRLTPVSRCMGTGGGRAGAGNDIPGGATLKFTVECIGIEEGKEAENL